MIMPKKRWLRKKFLKMRREMPEKIREDLSRKVQNRVLASKLWQNARTIGLYMALPDEVDTSLLLREAWAEGKGVGIPKVLDIGEGKMQFLPYFPNDALIRGKLGIREPAVMREGSFKPDLLLLPGLAFDHSGYRLGFGGGFYDRSCAEIRDCLYCGLGFEFQLVEKLPVEKWDIRLDAICTEEKLLWL